MSYAGDPILDFEDIKDLAFRDIGFRSGFEYYIGAYPCSRELSSENDQLVVDQWYPVKGRSLGIDQGPKTIQLTFLE